MTAHCSTCSCADDDRPPQPATSSAWARRAALEAAAAAVAASREKRRKPLSGPEPILTPEQHKELMRWSSPVIEGEVAE